MSSYPRPYRAGPIEPIVEVGQQVLLVDREAYNLYMVAYSEPIPLSNPIMVNGNALANPALPLTPIAAGATTAVLSTQAVLDNNYGQFAQLRAKVLDDVAVTIYQPQALSRFSLKNVNAVVNYFDNLEDPDGHLSEFFLYEDQRIFVSFRNPQGVGITISRVAFWGIKFVLAGAEGPAATGGKVQPLRRYLTINEAIRSGERFTCVPTGGWGR